MHQMVSEWPKNWFIVSFKAKPHDGARDPKRIWEHNGHGMRNIILWSLQGSSCCYLSYIWVMPCKGNKIVRDAPSWNVLIHVPQNSITPGCCFNCSRKKVVTKPCRNSVFANRCHCDTRPALFTRLVMHATQYYRIGTHNSSIQSEWWIRVSK